VHDALFMLIAFPVLIFPRLSEDGFMNGPSDVVLDLVGD
jgi:hypothetical protein